MELIDALVMFVMMHYANAKPYGSRLHQSMDLIMRWLIKLQRVTGKKRDMDAK